MPIYYADLIRCRGNPQNGESHGQNMEHEMKTSMILLFYKVSRD